MNPIEKLREFMEQLRAFGEAQERMAQHFQLMSTALPNGEGGNKDITNARRPMFIEPERRER